MFDFDTIQLIFISNLRRRLQIYMYGFLLTIFCLSIAFDFALNIFSLINRRAPIPFLSLFIFVY